MTFHSIRLAMAGLALGAAGAGFAQSAQKLPLAEELVPQLKPVLESALKQSPRLLARNLEVIQAEAGRRMAVSHLRPNVSASGRYLYGYEQRADLPNAGWRATGKLDYDVRLTQPAYHWGVLAAEAESGRIDEEIARHNYREGYRILALEIRSSYLQLILAKMTVRNDAYAEKLVRANLERQEIRHKDGLITTGEIQTHRLVLDEAKLVTRHSTTELDFAVRTFQRLSGNSSFAVADLPDAVPAPDQAPEVTPASASRAYLPSEELQVNELAIKKAALDYHAANYGTSPNLDFTTGLSQSEVSYTANIAARYKVQFAYVGVQLNWTIFDSGYTAGRKLSALTRRRQLEQTRAELLDTLPQRNERAVQEISLASDNYRNKATRLRFASVWLDFMRENLKRGENSQDQVDAAQTQAYSAEYAAQTALIGYLNAAAAYLSATQADPYANPVVNP